MNIEKLSDDTVVRVDRIEIFSRYETIRQESFELLALVDNAISNLFLEDEETRIIQYGPCFSVGDVKKLFSDYKENPPNIKLAEGKHLAKFPYNENLRR